VAQSSLEQPASPIEDLFFGCRRPYLLYLLDRICQRSWWSRATCICAIRVKMQIGEGGKCQSLRLARPRTDGRDEAALKHDVVRPVLAGNCYPSENARAHNLIECLEPGHQSQS
jgi:hypothetical protein